MINNIESGDSWRDQPFVWMIIAIPASAIVASMVMLTLAIQSDSGLVVDDYYKKGKEINRVLARDSLARSLGINALLTLDKDLGLIKVTLNGDNLNIGAKPLELQFLHSTRQTVKIYFRASRWTQIDPQSATLGVRSSPALIAGP